MKTVAIIAEYNPFHNGHKYQIDKIIEHFGPDTAIVAVMSGNYTQRGELAFMEKWERARAAVESSVNLVLELPFPYSMSSAEFFARAAVHIINSLGCIDAISFGSECGDIKELKEAAQRMLADAYKAELSNLISDRKNERLGYAKLCEMAYSNIYGIAPPSPTANNILALEYIKAAISLNSNLEMHTVKRSGAGYNEEKITPSHHQSATAIRKHILNKEFSAEDFIPKSSYNIILDEINSKRAPVDENKLELAILANLRLNSPDAECDVHDADGGLYNRLVRLSHEVNSLSAIKELASTKKYTDARIRRAIWFSYFGVTSSDVRELPEYTQILAMDTVGQAILKKARKTSKISVLNKPSGTPSTDAAKHQKELSDKADGVYQLAKPAPMPSSSIYKRGPYVEKDR